MKINRPVTTSNVFPGFIPLPGVLGRMARSVHFDTPDDENPNQDPAEITFTEAQQKKIDEIRNAALGKQGKKFDKDKADLEKKIADLEEKLNAKPPAGKGKDEDSIPKSEFEKLKKQLEDDSNTKVTELSTKLANLRSANLRADVVSAASKANAVDPDVVFALIKDSISYDEDETPYIAGENGKPRYGANGEYLTVSAYIDEFLKSKPFLVKSQAQPGGGSTSQMKSGKEQPTTALGKISQGLKDRRS